MYCMFKYVFHVILYRNVKTATSRYCSDMSEVLILSPEEVKQTCHGLCLS